jgi:hypothetical protein
VEYVYEEGTEGSEGATQGEVPHELEQDASHARGRAQYSMPPPSQSKLQPSSLSIMPAEWIQRFHQAAILGSDRQLLQLIEQMPATHASVARTLTHWINNFQFDRLLALTQPYLR